MILEHGPERIPETMQKPYKIHYSGAAGRTGEGALKALKTLEKLRKIYTSGAWTGWSRPEKVL